MIPLPESPLWMEHKQQQKQEKYIGHSLPNIEQNISKLQQIICNSIPPLLLFLSPLSGGYTISFYAISLVEDMKIGNADIVHNRSSEVLLVLPYLKVNIIITIT